MSSPTFWASLCCGCAPRPGGVRLGFGLGGGGGAGSGLEGAGGILFGFLSCPRVSRRAGLGGTAEEAIQATGEKKHSRAREKHEVTYKNNQVTRRKLGEKTSMAESKYTARCFPSKKKIKTKHEGEEKTREWHRKLLWSARLKLTSSVCQLPYFRTGCWHECVLELLRL